MRSYDLAELEEMSALSRRTISDYVSRGLLSGPSHRGRGARYSQRDLDALKVIPRLRTILKPEFPSLNSVRDFISELAVSDLRHLAKLSNERVFEIEVRRIRVQNRLRMFLPAISPERLTEVIATLTPEQVCGVDRGQLQVGTLLDIEGLSGEESQHGSDRHFPVDKNGQSGIGHGNQALQNIVPITGRDVQYERFGNDTVQVRIEKSALAANGNGQAGLGDTIRDFAQQLETLLKTPG